MFNRRDFLRTSLVGAAATAVPAVLSDKAFGSPAPQSVQQDTKYKIGYQLYGIRNLLSADADATMKAVSGCGIEGVEYSGMTNTPAITFRVLQNKYNLVCCGIHHGLTEWLQKGPTFQMEYSYILGNPDLACHWLDTPQRGSLENYMSHAKYFNELMPELKRNGFNFYYHNHQFEFQEVFNGKYAMDIMLENTDPALFSMEFHFSGIPAEVDPVKFIGKLGGRLVKLHFAVLDNEGNVALKPEIIEAAKASGSCKWFILEQNYPDLPTATERLKRSVDVVREMLNK